MPVNLFHVVKKGAKNKDKISEEFKKKLQSTGVNATVSSGTVSFSKELLWAKVSGTVAFAPKGEDLEITYTRNSEPTTISYAAGCLTLLITLLGVIVVWYLYDTECKSFDSTVQSMFGAL